jgi:hypothetical protein
MADMVANRAGGASFPDNPGGLEYWSDGAMG